MTAAMVWTAGLVGLAGLMGYVGLVELPRMESQLRSVVVAELEDQDLTSRVEAEVSGLTVHLKAAERAVDPIVALIHAEAALRLAVPPLVHTEWAGDWLSGPMRLKVSPVELDPPPLSDVDMARGQLVAEDAVIEKVEPGGGLRTEGRDAISVE